MAATNVNKQNPMEICSTTESNNMSHVIKMLHALKDTLDIDEITESNWPSEIVEVVKSILNENMQTGLLTDSQGSSSGSDVLSQQSSGSDAEYKCQTSLTAMRVSGPKKLRAHQKAIIRHELRVLMTSQVESGEGQVMQTGEGSQDTGPGVSMEDVDCKLRTITERLAHHQQESTEIKQAIKDIQLAAQIYAQNQQSQLLQAIYDTPPTSPEQTDGQTNMGLLDSVQICSMLLT